MAAVIDTGIDASHPDLQGKVLAFKDLVNGKTEPYDDQGHGSWVSGILAGSGATGADGRGVAPGAALVGVKVLDRYAQGSLAGIAAGIQWAVEHREEYGLDVINLSIGDPRYCGSGQDVASQAVDAAVAAGIVVVAAAGNQARSRAPSRTPAPRPARSRSGPWPTRAPGASNSGSTPPAARRPTAA